MKVGVQGTKEFKDYNVFMRAMGVALSSVHEGNEFYVYTAGPLAVNRFASEFINKSENSLKARGIKARCFMVPPSYIQENIKEFGYFAYFSLPHQVQGSLAHYAELSGVDVGLFRY